MAFADYSKIGIGEGKLYVGDTFATATQLGYTRGAEFNDNYEMRNIEVDGKKGNTVGDGHFNMANPNLNVTYMKMDPTDLEELFFGIEVTADTPAVGDTTIKRKTSNPVEADYKTFWWVGKLKDGNVWQIKLENVLGTGPMNMTFTDKSEIEIPVVLTCHFDTNDSAYLPYEKILLAAA